MQAIRNLTRISSRHWRRFSVSATSCQTEAQKQPILPLPVPPPSNIEQPLSPKIEKLIVDISNLSLLEVSQLTGGLKKRLNLPDAPVLPAAFAAVPAPKDEEDAAPEKVKSIFTVKLMKYDEKQKVPLIKEIKAQVEGMNLVQAKKFVESAPAVVKADVSKDEAEKLKEALSKFGAEVEIS